MEIQIRKNSKKTQLNKHCILCGVVMLPLALQADYLRQLKQVHEELGFNVCVFMGFLTMICKWL